MDKSDFEIVEYTLDLMRHALDCTSSDCSSCAKLRDIVKVVRNKIFDTEPYRHDHTANGSDARTPRSRSARH